MSNKDSVCISPGCEGIVPAARRGIGRYTCMDCGERSATRERTSWCVVPLHKSNYFLCTDSRDLAGINNKGGLVR
jgi:hypothetical protein